ncbi:hypothetical protein KCP74_06905 [Salmonella enterica subsp. enterica]|nr:hypothetical protein KCP74_06905 [Salmonella enterica subsp. enterica]
MVTVGHWVLEGLSPACRTAGKRGIDIAALRQSFRVTALPRHGVRGC